MCGARAATSATNQPETGRSTEYAWERWGNFINAQAGSSSEIPYDAARLQVKVYTFPTGEIRAIRLKKRAVETSDGYEADRKDLA